MGLHVLVKLRNKWYNLPRQTSQHCPGNFSVRGHVSLGQVCVRHPTLPLCNKNREKHIKTKSVTI